jgi:hypothetical protein
VRDADFRMNFIDPLPALLELAREQGWRWKRRGDY